MSSITPEAGQTVLSRRAQAAGGQPISNLMSRALANPQLISLAAGFVDQASLPAEAMRTAFETLFADRTRAEEALQYGTTPGYAPLRREILQRLRQQDGPQALAAYQDVTPDQLLITSGSNQFLHLLCDTLCDPGDIVLCAAPTYLVMLGTLANLHLRAAGISTDAEGIHVDHLEQTFRNYERQGELDKVRALYVVSYFDNPCGQTTSCRRRDELLSVVQRWSAKQGAGRRIRIIEDIAYRELRYSGPDICSIRGRDQSGQTVILAGTFSKSFSPGLRIGYGLLPSELVEPHRDQKGNIDFGSPNLNQHLMAQVLQSGLIDQHVERIRHEYAGRLTAMLSAADEYFSDLPGVRWQAPTGGLYVWLELPPEMDTGPGGTLLDAAMREGMMYVPGQFCFPSEGTHAPKNFIRLSFGVQSSPRIRDGMAALARALRVSLSHPAPTKET